MCQICCCKCPTFSPGCLKWTKEIFCLFLYLLYQGFMYFVLLSTCTGIAAVISFFAELCSYRPLGPDFQAVITLCLLTSFGESMMLIVKASPFHSSYEKKCQKYPILYGKIPFYIWFFCFILALSQLFVQYQNAHPSHYFGNFEHDYGVIHPDTLNTKSTLLFLFSMSFLIYSLPLQCDWMRYRYLLTVDELLMNMGNCLCYFFALTLQVILLFLYSLLLCIIMYIACFLKPSVPSFIFFCVIASAILLGKGAAELEKCPIPVAPLLRPPYFYENYMAARINLFQYILFPTVAFMYYGTGPIILLSAEAQFILYTFLLSLATFQGSKTVFNEHHLRPRRRQILQQQLDEEQQGGQHVDADVAPEPQLPSAHENRCDDSNDNNNNAESQNDNTEGSNSEEMNNTGVNNEQILENIPEKRED